MEKQTTVYDSAKRNTLIVLHVLSIIALAFSSHAIPAIIFYVGFTAIWFGFDLLLQDCFDVNKVSSDILATFAGVACGFGIQMATFSLAAWYTGFANTNKGPLDAEKGTNFLYNLSVGLTDVLAKAPTLTGYNVALYGFAIWGLSTLVGIIARKKALVNDEHGGKN